MSFNAGSKTLASSPPWPNIFSPQLCQCPRHSCFRCCQTHSSVLSLGQLRHNSQSASVTVGFSRTIRAVADLVLAPGASPGVPIRFQIRCTDVHFPRLRHRRLLHLLVARSLEDNFRLWRLMEVKRRCRHLLHGFTVPFLFFREPHHGPGILNFAFAPQDILSVSAIDAQ